MKRSMSALSLRQSKPLWSMVTLSMLISVLLTACRPNGAIRLTPGTPLPTPKESPTPAPTRTPAPPRLEPFIALCLVKTNTRGANFYASPDVTSDILKTLKNQDVLTVTVRSLDEAWVRGQNKEQATGWIQTVSVACTVPINELYVSKETGTILDVTSTAVVAATATALVIGTPSPTSVAANTATAKPTLPTATSTSTSTLTPTAIPATTTPTPPVTATSTRVPEIDCAVVITKGLNVRIGPSTEFQAFVKLAEKEIFVATGRNADGTWLAGFAPGQRPGWIIATSVRCASDSTQLPVVTNDWVLQQITPTPLAKPTEIPTPLPTATLQPTAAATRTSTPAPTATLLPTAAATRTPTAQPIMLTPTPTRTRLLQPSTPTPTAATAPGLQCTVGVSTGVYLRSGPARTFPPQIVVAQGEPFVALGRSANNGWLLGRDKTGILGWSIAGGIRCPSPIRTLPISRQIQPTLMPTKAP